ncbi:MAG: OmpA family protein [Gammaproteobacteria bacterium]|nr:OmpA family protein [Gammaproteobacteria bacterium]
MRWFLNWNRLLQITGIVVMGQFAFYGQAVADDDDACAVAEGVNERKVLATIFESLEHSVPRRMVSICNWRGVECNDDKSVIGLDLSHNTLKGIVPKEIGGLACLEQLNLSNNSITGTIPKEIGSLVNLEILDLSNNLIEGTIPKEIKNLRNLKKLYLNGNSIKGTIPKETGSLANLEILDLSSNSIEGTIPEEIGNLVSLEILDLSSNALTGIVPKKIGDIEILFLGLDYNGLYPAKDSNIEDFMPTQTLDATITGYTPEQSSIALSWDAVNYDQKGGYIIQLYDEKGEKVNDAIEVEGKGINSRVIEGLESGTDYFVEVRSFTNVHGDNKNKIISDGQFSDRFKVITKDADSDGDGILDNDEGKKEQRNSDGDDRPDYLDNDDDNDGIPTADEAPVTLDTDNDKIFNYLDPDDDNDKISTRDELTLGTDPLNTDSDGDGLADGDEVGDIKAPRNTDGDDLINALDSDDDDDGLSTLNERNILKTDPLKADSDEDGTPDGDEVGRDVNAPKNTDGDELIDALDPDDDNDGISTRDELTLGTDPLNTDSDGDGLADGDEVGDVKAPRNTDGDDLIDALDNDDDNDGLLTRDEQPGDFDDDGTPNYLDKDDVKPKPVQAEARDGGAVVTTSMGGGSMGWVMLMVTLLGLMRRFPFQKVFPAILLLLVSGQGAATTDEQNETYEVYSEDPQSGFYVGLGLGTSFLDPDVGSTKFSVAHNRDTAIKFLAGYEVTDYISIEMSGNLMGQAHLNPDNKYIKYNAYTLGAAYHFFGDIAGFSPMFKLGVSKLNNSANIQYKQDDSLLPFGSVGVKYEFDNGFAIRGEYEYIAKDAQVFSISALKYFGHKAKTVTVVEEPIAEPEMEVSEPSVDEAFVEPEMDFSEPSVEPAIVAPPLSYQPPGLKTAASSNVDSDSDGVNDASDHCSGTPDGAQVDEVGCAMFEGVLQGVNFESNSSELTNNAKYVLGEVAVELKNYPSITMEVHAHTDSDGSLEHNQQLSEQRANSVTRYLDLLGVSMLRMFPVGFGETKPITSNDSALGRAKNRRVELLVLPAQE